MAVLEITTLMVIKKITIFGFVAHDHHPFPLSANTLPVFLVDVRIRIEQKPENEKCHDQGVDGHFRK